MCHRLLNSGSCSFLFNEVFKLRRQAEHIYASIKLAPANDIRCKKRVLAGAAPADRAVIDRGKISA